MNTDATSFPPARVTPHAGRALAGIWRLTARRFFTPGYWLTLAGMLAVLVVFSIPAAPNQAAAELGFLPWAAGFYVCFLVPVLAFIGGAGAMRDDLGAATVDYVFTRPVPRGRYLVYRYLTQLGVAQIDFFLGLWVVTGIGLYWEVPELSEALPTLLGAQVTAVAVFTALGLCCGLLTARYVIVGIVYGALIEVGLGSVPTQLSEISLLRRLLGLVRPLLGDGGWVLSRAGIGDAVSVTSTLLVFAGVIVAAVGLGALWLSRREFAGSSRDG